MSPSFYSDPENYTETEIAADWVLGFMVFWSEEPVSFLEIVGWADEIGLTPEQLREGRALLGSLVMTSERDGEELWQLVEPEGGLTSLERVLNQTCDWMRDVAGQQDGEPDGTLLQRATDVFKDQILAVIEGAE